MHSVTADADAPDFRAAPPCPRAGAPGSAHGPRYTGQGPPHGPGTGNAHPASRADHHWFLINYGGGDASEATQRDVADVVTPWPGVPHGTAVAVNNVEEVGTDEVKAVVEAWIDATFGGGGQSDA